MTSDAETWRAVVGPDPSNHENRQKLMTPASVGPLELEPADIMHEVGPAKRPPQLNGGYSYFWSYPVRVSGPAIEPRPANPALPDMPFLLPVEVRKDAARLLHRLRMILALAWDRHWTVRDMPRPQAFPLPSFIGPGESELQLGSPEGFEHVPVEVPAWASEAWTGLETDKTTRDAAASHLEGVAISDWHPSFAFLAFVAAIEAIGQAMEKPERCPECNQIIGSTAAFAQALRVVMPDDQIRELNPAKIRSSTIHAAVLHGDETLLGSTPDWGEAEPERVFAWERVPALRDASRRLILQTLGIVPDREIG
jgi:hypothetical protein